MMDGIKGGGGGGRVGVGVQDMGDGMQCSEHPYRNNPGSICAFCLQEKLGKLVSSSFPLPTCGSSSSSSSSNSFKSDIASVGVGVGGSTTSNGGRSTSLSLVVRPTATKHRDDKSHFQGCHTRMARIHFLFANKKKITMASSSEDRDIVYKKRKSNSTTTPGRRHFLDTDYSGDFSPRKSGGFWSFFYLSSSKSSSTGKKKEKVSSLRIKTTATNGSIARPKEKCLGSSLSNKGHVNVVVEGDDSPINQATTSATSFERKVSRSRSVGCGSRSFSGDFFERISTGFGDCTLRRVKSQREGKTKVAATSNMKERVKCGGILSRFMVNSSSSSSSSSSHWVSSSAKDMNGRATAGPLSYGRSRSWGWGWAFASHMRAFSKPSSKDGKRDIVRAASSKNATPNTVAIPSLLAVRG